MSQGNSLLGCSRLLLNFGALERASEDLCSSLQGSVGISGTQTLEHLLLFESAVSTLKVGTQPSLIMYET